MCKFHNRTSASEGSEQGGKYALHVRESETLYLTPKLGRPARGKTPLVQIGFGTVRVWSDLINRLMVKPTSKLSILDRVIGVLKRTQFCDDMIRARTIMPKAII